MMKAATSAATVELAAARIALYRFLLAALDKPTAEQHAWLAGPDFRHSLAELCDQFGVDFPAGNLGAEGPAEHEARYISCFEVGVPAPPVVLLASHYNRREPVTSVIHEHILFYRRFGASLSERNIEPADHLLNQLAFLIRLDELFLNDDPGVASIIRARRDFLQRQAARWPAWAAVATVEKGLPAVYRALLALLAAAVSQDLELTEAALAQLTGEGS
jgi:TorA maturation chaperone TorD